MSARKTSIALILSTGRRDIKFWTPGARKDNDAGIDAMDIPSRSCRAIHEALISRGHRISLSLKESERQDLTTMTLKDALPTCPWGHPGKPARDQPRQQASMNRTRSSRDAPFEASNRRFSPEDKEILLDPQGRLLLRAAKVERLVSALLDSPDLRVQRVLVFYSDRVEPENPEDTRQFYDQEPAHNGQMIGTWLAQKDIFDLGLLGDGDSPGFGEQAAGIRWINYLAELDTLEGELYSPDHPVERAAVRSVDDAIHDLAEGFDGPVIVSALGGLGQIKPVILASAELHFQRRTFDYWETEAQSREPLSTVKPLTRSKIGVNVATAAEALAARAHALLRLREGDVPGSWGAIAHLESDQPPTRPEWLEWVKSLAAFFRGEPMNDLLTTNLFASDEAPTPGVDGLLLRGFQVEAALATRRVDDERRPEAIAAVTALADLALGLGIAAALGEIGYPPNTDRLKIDKQRVDDLRTRLRKDMQAPSLWSHEEDPWDLMVRGPGKLNTIGIAAQAWRIWLSTLPRTNEWQSLGGALADIEDFMQSEASGLRRSRNNLAHRALSSDEAHEAMANAGRAWKCGPKGNKRTLGPLWQRPTDSSTRLQRELGTLFLSQDLVRNIFAPFGIPDPEVRYRNLMTAAMNALRAPIQVTR